MALARMRRFVRTVGGLVDPASHELAGLVEALRLFIEGFEPAGGFRLLRVARPALLGQTGGGLTDEQPADRRLIALTQLRPALADLARLLSTKRLLTLIGIGGTARYVRGAMLDVKGAPYVTIAQAKGLSPFQVTVRHVLRNALIPVLTLLGLSLPALFSGAVFIEAIFAWPGVGRIMVEAVGARDYPVIMAATAVSALLVVLGNLLAETLAAWADPRLRAAPVSQAA